VAALLYLGNLMKARAASKIGRACIVGFVGFLGILACLLPRLWLLHPSNWMRVWVAPVGLRAHSSWGDNHRVVCCIVRFASCRFGRVSLRARQFERAFPVYNVVIDVSEANALDSVHGITPNFGVKRWVVAVTATFPPFPRRAVCGCASFDSLFPHFARFVRLRFTSRRAWWPLVVVCVWNI
jgi:hypothetical protein